MSLRVLTLNIWHTNGPWPERRRLIRAWIDLLQPDLIALQEVLRGPAIDQLAELFDASDYHTDFVTATRFWNDPTHNYGNAIASRWPMVDRAELPLPDAGDDERRIALSVTVDAPFGPLSFCATHLNWKPHHGPTRERQAAAIGEFVIERRPRGGFPALLAGDFNAVPDSTEIRFLKGLHGIDGRSVHLRDAWAMAGDGGPGVTWSNTNSFARPAMEPDRRIDYILVGPPSQDGAGVVESCRIVCNVDVNGVWPSDHFGVLADLRSPAPAL